MTQLIEGIGGIPLVAFAGAYNSNKNIVLGGSANLDMSGSTGTLKFPTGGATSGGVLVPIYEVITDNQNQVAAASYAVSHTIFVNDNVSGTYKIASLSAVFGTAGGSGCTVNVEVATGTQAVASGTNQMSSAVVLTGSANTVVNGTITTQTTIAAGSRVNLIFAGTVTGLANFSISLALQRLS